MKTIINNLAVEYTDEGQGPVILMLHGWMDRLEGFNALTERLTPNYRVVRLDLPGFGRSETPHDVWGIGEYVNFVQQFIRKLEVPVYALVGHSFGGRITIKGVGSGVLDPSRVVLLDSAGLVQRTLFRNRVLKLVAKAGKLLTRIPPFSLWRRSLRKRLYERLGSDYFAAGALSDIYLKVIAEDLAEYAKNITKPTLIVWGSNDATTPLADGTRLHAMIRDSAFHILEGLGHSPHREKPDEVARLMRDFLI